MRFFRHVFGTFATEIMIVALNFLVGVLVARLMPPAERGLLSLVMLLPVTLAYFADIGVSQSIVYFLGRRKMPPGQVLGNGLLLAGIFGLTVGAALWLSRDWLLHSVLKDLTPTYLAVALGLLPFLLVDAYLLSMLRGLQRFGLFNLRRLITMLLQLMGVVVFVGSLHWGVPGAVLALAVSTLISLILAAALVARLAPDRLRFDRKTAQEALAFGAKSYAQNLVGHLHYRLDIYLVALFLPPAEVAYYTVATSVAEFIFYIPDSVGTVLYPRLSVEHEDRVHSLTAEVARHTLFITALASLGLLVVGWFLIPVIYGPAYQSSVLPFMLLLPGMLSMAVYKVLTRNFTSRNRQQMPVTAALVGLGLNVALNLMLIPRLGLAGAALASLLSYTMLAAVLLWIFKHESGIGVGEVLLLRRSDLDRYRQLLGAFQNRFSGNKPGPGQVEVAPLKIE